ncbi:hypothetical protein AAG570_005387, partial [Ranatra chinensis]
AFVCFSYDGRSVGQVCLRGSQRLVHLRSLVAASASANCDLHYSGTEDPRFAVESLGGDLVAAQPVCMPTDAPWRVAVAVDYSCRGHYTSLVSPAQHTITVVVWFGRGLNETGRVRRTARGGEMSFERALYVASVMEEQEAGLEVCTVAVKTTDEAMLYSMVSLLDSRSQAMFGIDSNTGIVSTLTRLDREVMDVHYFRITASDGSMPPRSATTTLQVNVGDANDHAPAFETAGGGGVEASLSESSPVGTVVTQLRATDRDTGINAQIEYGLVSVDSGGLDRGDGVFSVDAASGLVTTRQPLDRETTEVYTLVAMATDQALPPTSRLTSTISVVVTVTDENDNYPQFRERTVTVTVPEDTTTVSNPVIATVRATDADSGQNAALRYAIIGGNTQGQFAIDSQNGEITLVKPLDYETTRSYRLVIRAQDGGSPGKSNTTQVLVNVKDVNDNAPSFYASLFQESISENVPVGFSIVRVQAYDGDEGGNSEVEYRISSHYSPDLLPITVDPHSGWLYTTKHLDREVESKFQFEVLAVDKGTPAKTGTTTVSIVVQDTNDNDPQFSPKEYSANLAEDVLPGTSVVTLHATDPDENPRLHYEIVSGNTRGRFAMTTQNGRGLITVAQPLDYKQERRFVLSVKATDSGGRYDTANVYINITDANTYSPVFDNAPYSATIPEDAHVGTTVLVVSASDADTGINAQITYSLSSETDHFSINPDTGAIVTTSQLDRETTSGYLLSVTAKDNGTPQLSDNTDVEITVTDVNDNAPKFSLNFYSVSVSEDVPIGTSVIQVSATDADMGLNGRVKYSIENTDTFIMEPITGVMRVNRALDRESVAMYNIIAVATDRATPPLSSTVIIHVNIDDVNDSPPTFESDKLTLYIAENSPVGSTVGAVHASDPDQGANAIVQYSIIGGEDASMFSLQRRAGTDSAELITLTELDYESDKKQYQVVVRATSAPLRSDAHLTIVVTDVNDNAPQLPDFQVIFNNFRECFPSGSIGRIPAHDADVSDKLKYRILSGNNAALVTLNETSGELSLSPQLNTNVPKVATMEVSVSDGVNEVKAWMELTVRLITDEMLLNSVTVRLADMTEQAFLSPLFGYFTEAVAAIIPCPKHNVYIFSVQDDPDPDVRILNVSFSVRQPDGQMYPAQLLQERIYLNRALLTKLSTLQVLPFDDNLCLREPCLNFEECLTVLKFGNASEFVSSDTVLFRPIYPVTTFACRCPRGFIGKKEHYLCDTEVNLCYSNPCKNGGECIQAEGGYTCNCKPDYTGDSCEVSIDSDCGGMCPVGSTCSPVEGGGYTCDSCPGDDKTSFQHYDRFCQLRARSFTPDTFVTFPALRQRNRLHLKLKFSTLDSGGLLLYNGRYNVEHDFIALELVDGNGVQFSFSLGSKITRVVAFSKRGLNDGAWHTVTVLYYNRTATVSLDDCDTALVVKFGDKINETCASRITQELENRCAMLTETCHRFLDLTGPLQIGGLPILPKLELQVTHKTFHGCVADVYIDHKLLDLNKFVGNNGSRVGCTERESYCASEPCHNGGTCRDSWGTFLCDCADGWSGPDCSQSTPSAWSFSGDGQLVFNPLLRPIQLPWETEFSIRTRQMDGFIMSVNIGQNSTATFFLESGFLTYKVDGDSVTLRSWRVSDGLWHRVSARLSSGQLRLSVDSTRVAESSLRPNLQRQFIGKVTVGILEPPEGFSGCLQDMRVGSSQGLQLLNSPTLKTGVTDVCQSTSQCGSGGGGGSSAVCPQNSHCVDEWLAKKCVCNSVCELNPCENGGKCIADKSSPLGYSCSCNSTIYTGEYCEEEATLQCPSSWWGKPNCGPCDCDTTKGYSPQCNSTTGKCHCKDRYYFVSDEVGCLPCECYSMGSASLDCNNTTGQCNCKPGVVGSHCDQCPNPYAQVTSHGCEVVYGGCPRNYHSWLWWEKADYGSLVTLSCPAGSVGKVTRLCDRTLPGWHRPDIFNCTSDAFLLLRRLLNQLETGDVSLNTYVAVELSKSLTEAINTTSPNMYGADVLIAQQLTERLLKYEANLTGLALTHVQHGNYIYNLVWTVGEIMSTETMSFWARIEQLTGDPPIRLQSYVTQYMTTLATSMRDTYTVPFETITHNLVLGLDVVSSETLFGYEVPASKAVAPGNHKETVILPDTSNILQPPIQAASLVSSRNMSGSPTIVFPKYNNYLKQPGKFDDFSRILIPIDLLGIRHIGHGNVGFRDILTKTQDHSGGIVSYALYRQGEVFPQRFDHSVNTRWGVQLIIGSTIVSVVAVNRDGTILSSGLKSPVRLQLWLRHEIRSPRTNPQCVRLTQIRGFSEWTRAGCLTELPSGEWWTHGVILVNCTCTTLSTHAVLVDLVAEEYIREPTEAEEVSSWIGLLVSLWCLCMAILVVNLVRVKANHSMIYTNQTFCLLLVQAIYLIALKARSQLMANTVVCKLFAISLHYLWLCALSWWLVSSVHLYRMLTQLRDVNRGPMVHYYSLSYGLPGTVVALAFAVRPDHYGNYFFCWISLYESVIWSMIGPGCVIVLANLLVLFLSLRAAFTVNHNIAAYGNLRTLVWLNVACVPLMVASWLISLINASEHSPVATLALGLALPVHSGFLLASQAATSPALRRIVLRLAGKKLPEPTAPPPSRSSMAYRTTVGAGAAETARRHLGISNSSTTSRSTTKTSSSPYRSDNQLRNTSTSTSNYEPSSDRRAAHTSESDSEGSADGRSLELASSHSSDDEGGASSSGGAINPTDPPQLNIVANSQLFQPIYAPRWPTSYVVPTGDDAMPPHRWTSSTISDNELVVKLTNLYSSVDAEEKASIGEKYLFPYTGTFFQLEKMFRY